MADIAKLATDIVEACARHDFAAAYAEADPMFTGGYPEFMLGESWQQTVRRAGQFKSILRTEGYRWVLAPLRAVVVVCQFERQEVHFQLGFSAQDKLLGITILTPGLG